MSNILTSGKDTDEDRTSFYWHSEFPTLEIYLNWLDNYPKSYNYSSVIVVNSELKFKWINVKPYVGPSMFPYNVICEKYIAAVDISNAC